jgi:putative restriction endonuclease
MVSLYIANTDDDWFDFLSSESDVTEVNFWQPGAKSFHAIEPGELFAFRHKSPRDKLGGFGVLSNSSILPLQIAWETFGHSNGASSYSELRTAIARYRNNEDVGPTTNIGCRILVEPIFFPPHLWMELPASWSRNIVGGKRYSTDDADGLKLWNLLQEIAQSWTASRAPGFSEPAIRYGKPTLITPRLNGTFLN